MDKLMLLTVSDDPVPTQIFAAFQFIYQRTDGSLLNEIDEKVVLL